MTHRARRGQISGKRHNSNDSAWEQGMWKTENTSWTGLKLESGQQISMEKDN